MTQEDVAFGSVTRHANRMIYARVAAVLDGSAKELHAAGKAVPLQLDARITELDGHPHIEASTPVDHRELGMTGSPLGIVRDPSKLIVRGRLIRD